MELQSKGIKSVSFDELNNQLRDEYGGEEPPMLITPELVSSEAKKDPDMQYYIKSITPDKVEISEPTPWVGRGRTPSNILGLNSPEYAAAQKANGGFAGGAWAHLKKNESSVKKVSESAESDRLFITLKFLYTSGVKSLTFRQLNKYLQNAGQGKITYDLLSLMFDEDPRLQMMITSMSPDEIQLGKKTDDNKLSQQANSDINNNQV